MKPISKLLDAITVKDGELFSNNPNETIEYLFVYETLKNIKLQQRLLHRKIKEEFDFLMNFKEITVHNYPTLVSEPKSKVKGMLLYLTTTEINNLDSWENKYKRIKLKLNSGKMAWVYILKVSNIFPDGVNPIINIRDDKS